MTKKRELYPLLFTPVYKDYIWGGNRISRRYNRGDIAGIVAESWEISDRPEGISTVTNGPMAGETLDNIVKVYGSDLLGYDHSSGGFPLLIKIIDARERLSLQVHPDEESAAKVGGEPKTEMWVALDADPGALVYAGFKAPSSETAFRAAVKGGTVESLLKPLPVCQSDVIYVPGGRVHCIGGGCLLLEVQQNSNTTFRVHDWGRMGHDGKPRELHLEQAIQVIRWDDTGPDVDEIIRQEIIINSACGTQVQELVNSPCFYVERIKLSGKHCCATDGKSFHILFIEQGSVCIHSKHPSIEIGPGTSVLIPACQRDYQLSGSQACIFRISIPYARE